MNNVSKSNDLNEILTQALDELKHELGNSFDINKVNLAELSRRTGISRARLRRLKENGYKQQPHGLTGRKATVSVLSGYTSVLDDLLRKNVSNSAVCFERLKESGYKGSLSTVKRYIASHRDLLPPKRFLVDPQGNRGRRYRTDPGETFQMDWGFVHVDTDEGSSYRAAVFAMICHHCGKRYIEFFPNATQENLFIGMIHAFIYMGIPKKVLTDNMKSVVIRRDVEGKPIWQHDYEVFMDTVGFSTGLCKPRHPFTKGKVERLIRFVKDNFLAARTFGNVTDLNIEALRWCGYQNSLYQRAMDCVPDEKHDRECSRKTKYLEKTHQIALYLCPERRLSFDGFINYEGRRFGVPYWYTEHTCRVQRSEYVITIYSSDLSKVLTTYDVTWSRYDRCCRDQYVREQPEEYPTMPVKTRIYQLKQEKPKDGFEKFNFEEGLWDDDDE